VPGGSRHGTGNGSAATRDPDRSAAAKSDRIQPRLLQRRPTRMGSRETLLRSRRREYSLRVWARLSDALRDGTVLSCYVTAVGLRPSDQPAPAPVYPLYAGDEQIRRQILRESQEDVFQVLRRDTRGVAYHVHPEPRKDLPRAGARC